MYVIKDELDYLHKKNLHQQIFLSKRSDPDPVKFFQIRTRPVQKFRIRPDPDPRQLCQGKMSPVLPRTQIGLDQFRETRCCRNTDLGETSANQ